MQFVVQLVSLSKSHKWHILNQQDQRSSWINYYSVFCPFSLQLNHWIIVLDSGFNQYLFAFVNKSRRQFLSSPWSIIIDCG